MSKCVLEERDHKSVWGYGPVADCYEHGTESSGSIQGETGDCQLIKRSGLHYSNSKVEWERFVSAAES
jgi:hypothetical protein